jgi:ribonucleotide reductase alpha subunit
MGTWMYRKASARELFDQIMRSTYNHAEPGVIFIDRVNQDNNLSYVETIAATNPCGEQALPPYGCCCLGSINLTKFVNDPFGEQASFDFESSATFPRSRHVRSTTCSMQRCGRCRNKPTRQPNKRRIGLGFTGLGNALTMLGLRYDSDAGRSMAADIARTMRDAAYEASAQLAQEKGAFPLFDAEKFLAGTALRFAPSGAAEERDSRERHSQLASAVDRADLERSRSRSPVTRRAASSQLFHGPTCARSACRTAPGRNMRSRTTRTGSIGAWAATSAICRMRLSVRCKCPRVTTCE